MREQGWITVGKSVVKSYYCNFQQNLTFYRKNVDVEKIYTFDLVTFIHNLKISGNPPKNPTW